MRRKIVTLSYHTKNPFQKWSSVSERIWAWKEVLRISLRCEWLTQSFWESGKSYLGDQIYCLSSINWSYSFVFLNLLVTRFYWTDLFDICPIPSWSEFLKGDGKSNLKDIKLESYSAKSASSLDMQKPNNKTKNIPEYNLNSNISPSIRIF